MGINAVLLNSGFNLPVAKGDVCPVEIGGSLVFHSARKLKMLCTA